MEATEAKLQLTDCGSVAHRIALRFGRHAQGKTIGYRSAKQNKDEMATFAQLKSIGL